MKRYHYTLAEQETIINWDNELDEATVYTFDRRLISKLKALAAKYPEHYVLLDKGAQSSVTYRVPKRCIGIRPPYSDMRRKQQAEDAKTKGLPFDGKEKDEDEDFQMG
jgi:hypothetical protein